MLRVVNEGSLCTRNGRIINEDYKEISQAYKEEGRSYKHVCYDEDIEYDFGGHIWAGRISWLRKAWNHIPFSLENSEDFWISAALKSFYNISTKTPKCPCPKGNPITPDMCAASDNSSREHVSAIIGTSQNKYNMRSKLMKEIIEKFNYQRMIYSKPDYVQNMSKKFVYGYNIFNLSDDLWKESVFWQ